MGLGKQSFQISPPRKALTSRGHLYEVLRMPEDEFQMVASLDSREKGRKEVVRGNVKVKGADATSHLEVLCLLQ